MSYSQELCNHCCRSLTGQTEYCSITRGNRSEEEWQKHISSPHPGCICRHCIIFVDETPSFQINNNNNQIRTSQRPLTKKQQQKIESANRKKERKEEMNKKIEEAKRKKKKDKEKKAEQKRIEKERKKQEKLRLQELKKFQEHISIPLVFCGVCLQFRFEDELKQVNIDIIEKLWSNVIPLTLEEIKLNHKEQIYICNTCHNSLKKLKVPKFSADNLKRPGDIPDCISTLSMIEIKLISPVLCFQTIISVGLEQRKAQGHVLNIENDITTFAKKLPRSMEDINTVIVKLNSMGNVGSKIFDVSPPKILAALEWLKKNNPHYVNIDIDMEMINQLSQHSQIQIVETEDVPKIPTNYGNGPDSSDEVDSNELDSSSFDLDEIDIMETIWDPFDYKTNQHRERLEDEIDSLIGCSDEERWWRNRDAKKEQKNNQKLEIDILRDSYLAPIDEQEDPKKAVIKRLIPDVITVDRKHEEPIQDFNKPELIALVFPNLFPYGIGTMKDDKQGVIKRAEFFKHLTLQQDRRFIEDHRFPFFALNLIQRHTLAGVITAADRNGVTNSIADLKADLLGNGNNVDGVSVQSQLFLNSLVPFNKGNPGSALFMKNHRSKLIAMNKSDNVGPAEIFHTVSPADTYWQEFFDMIGNHNPKNSIDAKETEFIDRQRALREYPDFAVMHYQRRWKAYWKYVVCGKSKPLSEIKDHWYRVEFQDRGSPHTHCLFWTEKGLLRDDDIRDFCHKSVTAKAYYVTKSPFPADKEFKEDELFEENYVSVDKAEQEPIVHPSHVKAPLEDYSHPSTQKDLENLALKCQIHSHNPKCRRKKWVDKPDPANNDKTIKKQVEYCRYNFPKPTVKETRVYRKHYMIDGHEEISDLIIDIERNHPNCNQYNVPGILAWRANQDIQYVADPDAACAYLPKYVSKNEPKGEEYQLLLESAIEQLPEDSTTRQKLNAVAFAQLSHRQVSFQEALWILYQYSYVVCSRTFDYLNLAKPNDRKTFISEEGEAIQTVVPKQIAKYCLRPNELENMSLLKFTQTYNAKKSTGKTTLKLQDDTLVGIRKKEAVVQFSGGKFKIQNYTTDEFTAYALLKLYLPFRNENDLQPENKTSVEYLEEKIKDFPGEVRMFIENSSRIEESIAENTEKYFAEQQEKELEAAMEIVKENQIKLKTLMPDLEALIQSNNQCGNFLDCVPFYNEEQYSLAKDWIKDQEKASSEKFVQDMVAKYSTDRENVKFLADNLLTLEDTLNEEQKQVYNIIKQQLISNQTFQIVIHGAPGVGKSYVINILCEMVRTTFGFQLYDPVKVMSPTGTASALIHGQTYQKALKMNEYNSKGTSNKSLMSLQAEYSVVKLIIFDEFSMLGTGGLNKMELKLREIGDDEPFGGFNVVFCGDFYQLDPVKDPALYIPFTSKDATNETKSATAIRARSRRIWVDIPQAFILKTQQRQKGDIRFAAILNNMRTNSLTETDLTTLEKRQNLNTKDVENFLAGTNKTVQDMNIKKLESIGKPYVYLTWNVVCSVAREKKDISKDTMEAKLQEFIARQLQAYQKKEKAQKLPDGVPPIILPLCIGAKVTLTKNLSVDLGLTNGASGVIKGFAYAPEVYSEEDNNVKIKPTGDEIVAQLNPLPILLVQMDESTFRSKNSFSTALERLVPIPPIKFNAVKNGPFRFTITALPITLGFASTIHKCQGQTYNNCLLDLNDAMAQRRGMAYVACSRVKHLKDLFLEPLNSRLSFISNSPHRLNEELILQNEIDRLTDLHNTTIAQFDMDPKFCIKKKYPESTVDLSNTTSKLLQQYSSRLTPTDDEPPPKKPKLQPDCIQIDDDPTESDGENNTTNSEGEDNDDVVEIGAQVNRYKFRINKNTSTPPSGLSQTSTPPDHLQFPKSLRYANSLTCHFDTLVVVLWTCSKYHPVILDLYDTIEPCVMKQVIQQNLFHLPPINYSLPKIPSNPVDFFILCIKYFSTNFHKREIWDSFQNSFAHQFNKQVYVGTDAPIELWLESLDEYSTNHQHCDPDKNRIFTAKLQVTCSEHHLILNDNDDYRWSAEVWREGMNVHTKMNRLQAQAAILKQCLKPLCLVQGCSADKNLEVQAPLILFVFVNNVIPESLYEELDVYGAHYELIAMFVNEFQRHWWCIIKLEGSWFKYDDTGHLGTLRKVDLQNYHFRSDESFTKFVYAKKEM